MGRLLTWVVHMDLKTLWLQELLNSSTGVSYLITCFKQDRRIIKHPSWKGPVRSNCWYGARMCQVITYNWKTCCWWGCVCNAEFIFQSLSLRSVLTDWRGQKYEVFSSSRVRRGWGSWVCLGSGGWGVQGIRQFATAWRKGVKTTK